ncbi:MAG: PQQ-binding-like beta-propeller repeat protein [Mariniblastus sp.]
MNDEKKSESLDGKTLSETKTKSRFPKKMLIWTVFLAIVLFVLHWQLYNFNEWFNMNPAVPSLAALLLVPLTIYAWSFWCFFWGRLRLVGIFVFLAPTIFFYLYTPKFLGDANFVGFTPRFWTRAAEFKEAETDTGTVDVVTTTPNDFPQFLGPNRNSKVAQPVKLAAWSDRKPEQLWKIDVGNGWSGFSVVNGFAITQEQRGAEELVSCYDIMTGELKWANRSERRHEDTMAMGKAGPRATPTVHDGLVYVTSATGVLDCIDGATGETIWTADVPKLVGIEQNEKTNSMGLNYTEENSTMAWGRSGSPLIVDDMVVVTAGGPAPTDATTPSTTATLIAFNKKVGAELWRGGSRMVAYGSPALTTIAGRRQIILVAEDKAVGHDVETGEELWNFDRPGSSSGAANCSQATFVGDDRIIFSKGYGSGGELVKIKNDGEKFSVESLHKDPRVLKTKLTSPVIHEGHAYSLSDGFLECTEVDSFRRKWKVRGRFGNGQLLLVGDKLIVHAELGELFLVAADPSEYKELGTAPTIQGICWNTICLYGDLLLVRSDLEAACYRLPTEP